MNSELWKMVGEICGCGLVLLFPYSFIRITVVAFLQRNPHRFLVIFIAVPLILGLTDYTIALKKGHPMLSFPTVMLLDGGSNVNIGWGYTILKWHQIVIHPSLKNGVAGFKVGLKLTFWFLLGLESSEFKATEMEAPTKRSNTTPVPLRSTGEVER
ncbi:MAG: hypothetical protein HYV36_03135 [Lentisphaerae bacterium]|nr:hypothetical protein [Lentisphaerota bacterium]